MADGEGVEVDSGEAEGEEGASDPAGVKAMATIAKESRSIWGDIGMIR